MAIYDLPKLTKNMKNREQRGITSPSPSGEGLGARPETSRVGLTLGDQEFFPGITLFAQLPGPVAGMLAFNELIACSKRLHAALGGTLQDERGVPLTVHRIERIRQEIREFEQRPAYDPSQRSSHPVSPSP